MRPGVWRAHNQRQPLSWQGMNGCLISAAEAIDNQQHLSKLTGPHIQAGLPVPQNSNLQLLAPSDHMTWKQSQPLAIVGGLWRPPVVLAGPQRPASYCEFPRIYQASSWPAIIKIKKRKYLEGIYADFKSSSYFKDHKNDQSSSLLTEWTLDSFGSRGSGWRVFGIVMRQCSAFVYNKYISQVEATNKSEFH